MTTGPAKLVEFAPGAVWYVDYPVRFGTMDLVARMSVIRLSDGRLILHSPCEISPELKAAIEALGPVGWIVAPGNFHHLHVASAQAAFADAKTFICPGVEKKQPSLAYDALLGDTPPEDWAGEIGTVLVDGNWIIDEVVLYHRASRTLIVTDLIELIGDRTEGVGWQIWLWWKLFRMWNKPRPAPEYAMYWKNRKRAAAALRRVLEWDFERIVIAHGDLVTENAHAVAEDAWARVLKHGQT